MFNIYPSILDSFNYYRHSESGDISEIISRINRVQSPPTEPMLTGIDLEDIVSGLKPFDGTVNGNEVDKKIIDELSERLNPSIKQTYLDGVIDTGNFKVRIYGRTDFIKMYAIKDLKYTGKYDFPKYNKKFQHVTYLFCADYMGIDLREFEYVITDLKSVYVEFYKLTDLEIDRLKNEIDLFCDFLLVNKDKVTDLKIYGQ